MLSVYLLFCAFDKIDNTTVYNGHNDDNLHRKLYRDLFTKYNDAGGIHMRPVRDPSTPTTVTYRMLVGELIDLVSVPWGSLGILGSG